MEHTSDNDNSSGLRDPPLPGAKELGEKLESTLLKMAKTTLLAMEERESARKDIFHQRNLANKEWQLLHTKGQEERQANQLKAKRTIEKISQVSYAIIQKQKEKSESYEQAAKCQRAEETERAKIVEKQMFEESENSRQGFIERQLQSKIFRSQEEAQFKNEKLNEIKAVEEKCQASILEMEENHRKNLKELAAEEQQTLEEELLPQKRQQIMINMAGQKTEQLNSTNIEQTLPHTKERKESDTSLLGNEWAFSQSSESPLVSNSQMKKRLQPFKEESRCKMSEQDDTDTGSCTLQNIEEVSQTFKQDYKNFQRDISFDRDQVMPNLCQERILDEKSLKQDAQRKQIEVNHQKQIKEIRQQNQLAIDNERRRRKKTPKKAGFLYFLLSVLLYIFYKIPKITVSLIQRKIKRF